MAANSLRIIYLHSRKQNERNEQNDSHRRAIQFHKAIVVCVCVCVQNIILRNYLARAVKFEEGENVTREIFSQFTAQTKRKKMIEIYLASPIETDNSLFQCIRVRGIETRRKATTC